MVKLKIRMRELERNKQEKTKRILYILSNLVINTELEMGKAKIMKETFFKNLKRNFWYGLACVPLLVLLVFVAVNATNFPYNDQWEIVPVLEKLYSGTLTFQDLWMRHNEHRILFPRIVMVALAYISNWNICYEITANVILGICIFGLIIYQINKIKEYGKIKGLVLFGISLLVFSVSQAENWLWGWQMQIFMNVAAFIAGVFLLASQQANWCKLILACIAGIVATYSFANGICFWGIGFCIILLQKRHMEIHSKYLYIVVWVITSCLVMFSFFYNYQRPRDQPLLWFITQNPEQSLQYFLVYLGAPLASFSSTVATIFGLMGLIGFLWLAYCCFNLYKRKTQDYCSVLPWLALIVYSITSAMITTLGRAELGVSQALSSRYITISNLMWISLLVMIPWINKNYFHSEIFLNKKIRIFVIILLCICEARMMTEGWVWGIAHYRTLETARNQIINNIYDDKYIRNNVYPGDLRERISVLTKLHLTAFH